MNRPTEVLTAAVSSLVAAAITILAAFYPEVASKITAEVTAAIVLVLAWTAHVVTYFVARRLADPASPIVSAPDGSIQKEVTSDAAPQEP